MQILVYFVQFHKCSFIYVELCQATVKVLKFCLLQLQLADLECTKERYPLQLFIVLTLMEASVMSACRVLVKPLSQTRVMKVPASKIVARKTKWRMLKTRPVVSFHCSRNNKVWIFNLNVGLYRQG